MELLSPAHLVLALVTPREESWFAFSGKDPALQELRARNMSCEHEKHLHKDLDKNFMWGASGQRVKGGIR
jgi:hypothetical protein